MRESYIEHRVTVYAVATYDAMQRKLNGSGNRHWPDREYLFSNRAILFIEFKRPGEKPTAAQEIIHEELRKRGYTVLVIDDIKEGKRAVDAFARKHRVKPVAAARVHEAGHQVRRRTSGGRTLP